jgi:hypothetical protein
VGLGRRIFTLWQLRPYVAACGLLASFVAIYSVAHISLAPPSVRPRALQMATATTHLVVDTPKTTILDLRQNTYSFEALTQRAILLGNVMANGPVRQAIADRANVPVDVLQVSAPLTAKEPRATTGAADRQKKMSDVLKSTDQYRLSIQANPTVPVLDIYAQAPTAAKATILANSSVDSLRTYLEGLAASKQVPATDQIKILQLGRARGTVINKGIDWQTSFLAFWLTFGFACATVIFLSRIRRGWKLAALAERPAEG